VVGAEGADGGAGQGAAEGVEADGAGDLVGVDAVEDFARDLSDAEQTVLTATQGPTSLIALGAPISTPAWRNKPSWFVIAAHDRVVLPTLQAMFAERMNATSITLSSSHVAMLSQPYVVASFTRRAAREVQ